MVDFVVARKESPARPARRARIEREIATVVASPAQPSFPALRVTKVYPERVDEWYGVGVEFRWVRPLDVEAHRRASRAEEEAWFADSHRTHVGLFPLERAMGDHIRREIARSPQWVEFFARQRSMPRFTERDIDNWSFDAQGGTASASTRDDEVPADE